MKGWTLEHVWALDGEVYDELVAWISEEANRDNHDGSVDMDAVMAAKRAKDEQDG